MKVTHGPALLAAALALFLAGCKDGSAPRQQAPARDAQADANPSDRQEGEAAIRASLGKLSPEDRKLAEGQRFCAVQDGGRLGSMGKPFKVLVKGEPVFLCCKSCQMKALADPDKTLAKVRELRAKAEGSPAKRP
jgi:hypothetical protein